MSLILNIETSTKVCSVALSEKEKLLALKESNEERYAHSENLTVFIQHTLSEAKINFKELDAIAVSKGPGSYTGLRIGVSTAKGLCYSLDKPLIGIETLKSLAKSKISNQKFQNATLFCPMLDARRMEVYCAVYDCYLNEIKKTAAEIIDENSFSDLLEKNTICFFGEGAEKCKMKIIHPNAKFIDNVFPSAKNMIELSAKKFQEKQFEDTAYFEPFYLKDFVGKKLFNLSS